jgi:hypothetical protein
MVLEVLDVAEAHRSVRLPWSGTFHSVANRFNG